MTSGTNGASCNKKVNPCSTKKKRKKGWTHISLRIGIAILGIVALNYVVANSRAAGTYYVDPTGSNNPTCDIGSPCASIQYVHDSIAGAGDTIHLNIGTYTENVVLSKSIIIEGGSSDPTLTVVNGNAVGTVFVAISGTVQFDHFTITNGSSFSGGGIDNGAALTLDTMMVIGNNASGNGAGMNSNTTSQVTVNNSTFAGNISSFGNGGGIYSTAPGVAHIAINGGTFTENHALTGGAIEARGVLTVDGTNISSNVATNDGGGIHFVPAGSSISNATISGNTAINGGGIYGDCCSGSATQISNTSITGNSATSGAGIYNTAVSITVTNGSIISGNIATGDGGGIASIGNAGFVKTQNSQVTLNQAARGAGAYALNAGSGGTQVTFDTGTTVDSNVAATAGGGIYVDTTGTAQVNGSTIKNNSVTLGAGGGAYNTNSLGSFQSLWTGNTSTSGGAAVHNTKNINFGNTTLSANVSSDGSAGAGIRQTSTGSMGSGMNGVTMALNQPYNIYSDSGSSTSFQNTILSNTAGGATLGTDCGGPQAVNSLGYNIDVDGTCGIAATGDLSTVDPLLEALGSNGGNTQTHALQLGSVALDSANALTCWSTDQRSEPRTGSTAGTACDRGAYEYQITPGDAYVDPTGSDAGNFCQNIGARCATIGRALSVVGSGYTVYVAAGTYNESGLDTLSKSITITGEAADPTTTIIDAQLNDQLLSTGSGTVSLSGLTLRNGSSPGGYGGALYAGGTSFTITNSIIESSTAAYGAGIYASGTLNLDGVTIQNNTATAFGGGLYVDGTAYITRTAIRSNSANNGGGIVGSYAYIPISLSEISGNNATIAGNAIFAGSYTGIELANSTVSGSSSTTISGVRLAGYASFDITDSTIQGIGGYNISSDGTSTASLRNSIIANPLNTANCDAITPTSNGYNVSDDTSCNLGGTGDQQGVTLSSINLGPLQNNGGTTSTHELLAGSVARDTGNPLCPATDQREVNRTDGNCDTGAYEAAGIVVVPGDAYVSTTGDDLSGTNDCKDSNNRCRTIGHALTMVGDGYTVYIAEGTYNEGGFSIAKNITVQGETIDPATVIIDATSAPGSIFTINGTTVELKNFTAANGNVTGSGGAVNNTGSTTIDNVIATGNTASEFGGAIENTGIVVMRNSALTNNSAVYDGGAIDSWDVGSLTIENTEISGNNAESSGAIWAEVEVVITNSTVSGNTTTATGGALWLNGPTTISFSTITDNTGNNIYIGTGTTQLSHTIISSPATGSNCAINSGTIASLGYNIESTNSCTLTGTGDLTDTDPLLDPLAANGGVGQTHALQAASPAVDSGDPACDSPACPTTDQRGTARPQASGWDRGAYELIPAAIVGDAYVSTTGDDQAGGNNCMDSNNRCRTIEHALTQVGDGYKIYVAPGTYAEGALLVSKNIEIRAESTNPTSTVVDANAIPGSVFTVDTNMTVTMSNFTVTNGSAVDGAGILNMGTLTATNMIIAGNAATGYGGGIENYNNLTVTDSAIRNNSATQTGGGVDHSGNMLTMTRSEISGNTSGFGGGLYALAETIFTNGTVSGNSASLSGGGMYIQHTTLDLSFSTVANNSEDNIYAVEPTEGFTGGIVNLNNSIIASAAVTFDCAGNGTFVSGGWNIDSDNTCNLIATGDHPSTNPMLNTLANNTGYTYTHELQLGSTAIDAANPNCTTSTCPTTDQRGVDRPQDGSGDIAVASGVAAWDIGSYERKTTQSAVTPTPTPTPTPLPEATVTPTPSPTKTLSTGTSTAEKIQIIRKMIADIDKELARTDLTPQERARLEAQKKDLQKQLSDLTSLAVTGSQGRNIGLMGIIGFILLIISIGILAGPKILRKIT